MLLLSILSLAYLLHSWDCSHMHTVATVAIVYIKWHRLLRPCSLPCFLSPHLPLHKCRSSIVKCSQYPLCCHLFCLRVAMAFGVYSVSSCSAHSTYGHNTVTQWLLARSLSPCRIYVCRAPTIFNYRNYSEPDRNRIRYMSALQSADDGDGMNGCSAPSGGCRVRKHRDCVVRRI